LIGIALVSALPFGDLLFNEHKEATVCGAHNMKRRREPMDTVIESALQPGRFIDWKQGNSFLEGLYEAEREIETLMASDPERAACVYETFVAACNLKANEVDDSGGKFGIFVGSLLCGWIQARQAAAAEADKTAETLLSWMENDDYGFFSDLKSEAAKVLDRRGLASFERAVRARFESACLKPEERVGGYYRDSWGQVLRSIYAQHLPGKAQTARSPCLDGARYRDG
jgi:hypothetical protein